MGKGKKWVWCILNDFYEDMGEEGRDLGGGVGKGVSCFVFVYFI